MDNLKCKIITIGTMKGGTGKTTLTFNIGCLLAEEKKVLLIDLDPQANLSHNFGYNVKNVGLSVADMFEETTSEIVDPLDVVCLQPLEQLPNLDIIPSTIYLQGTEVMLMQRTMREFILKGYIMRHAEFFNEYDYIIFDTPPSFSCCTQNALFISDHIILVTDPDPNSASGADVFLYLWEQARMNTNLKDNVDALILNNIERTKSSSNLKHYVEEESESLAKIKLNTCIPHTTRYKDSNERNLPIFLWVGKDKKTEASRYSAEVAMRSLLNELKERGIF